MGYHQAGFTMVGVDLEPQKNYPFEFIQANALEVLLDADFLSEFDFIHTSPLPEILQSCQAMEGIRKSLSGYPGAVRLLLKKSGKPFIMENVQNAPLFHPLILEGQMFGLKAICGVYSNLT